MPRPTTPAWVLLPEPEPLALAGKPYTACQLRLRQIARMERELAALGDDPLAGLDRITPETPPDDRRAILGELAGPARDWPVVYGSARARELIRTPAGAAIYAWAALAPHNDLPVPAALELALGMTAAEWKRLDAVLWGLLPAEVVAQLLDDTPASAGSAFNWPAVIDRLSFERGLTYEQVGNLHIAQAVNMLDRGKGGRGSGGRSFSSIAEALAFSRRRMEAASGGPGANGTAE